MTGLVVFFLFRVHLAVANDCHIICATRHHVPHAAGHYRNWNIFEKSVGVDVTANQDEISDHETFQLEFDVTTGRWYIRTMGDRYWTLETAGGIQASSAKK